MARQAVAVLALGGVIGLLTIGPMVIVPGAGSHRDGLAATSIPAADVGTSLPSGISWSGGGRHEVAVTVATAGPASTGSENAWNAAPALDAGGTGDVAQVPALQPIPVPDIPDIPNPFDAFDRLNPKNLANDLLNAMLTAIGGALLKAIRGFVDWALGLGDSSLNIITHTPAQGTYQSPTVRSLWDFSRALTNAALALVVMWGGFGVMVKEHTRSPYHDLMELLPRVVLGALGANLTLVFAAFLIDANNAVAAGVGQVGLPGYDQATPTQEGMALIVTALVYGVVAILLVLQMLMRLALIDLLIILAPLAMLAWVLPQTQGWFRWWSSLFPTTVFQQVLQVMTLRLGAALMVELTPGSVDGALLTLFLGIAVCWLTLKVPALLRPGAHRAGLSSVVSLVLVSRVAGGLVAGGAGATGGSAAGAMSAHGTAPQPSPHRAAS